MVDDYFIHTILVDNVMFALEESYAFAQVAAIPWHVQQLFTASSFSVVFLPALFIQCFDVPLISVLAYLVTGD